MIYHGFWFKRKLPIYSTGTLKVLLKNTPSKCSLWGVCVRVVEKVSPVTEEKERKLGGKQQTSCQREDSGRPLLPLPAERKQEAAAPRGSVNKKLDTVEACVLKTHLFDRK